MGAWVSHSFQLSEAKIYVIGKEENFFVNKYFRPLNQDIINQERWTWGAGHGPGEPVQPGGDGAPGAVHEVCGGMDACMFLYWLDEFEIVTAQDKLKNIINSLLLTTTEPPLKLSNQFQRGT